MIIDSVIDQIKAHCPLFAGNVAGAAAYANGVVDQVWLPLPSAYVVPAGDTASENMTLNGTYQLVTEHIHVYVVLSNVTAVQQLQDRRGQTILPTVDAARTQLYGVLLNWRPEFDMPDPAGNRETRGFTYEGGALEEMDRARLIWRFEFGCVATITDADAWQLVGPPLQIQLTAQVGNDPTAQVVAVVDTQPQS